MTDAREFGAKYGPWAFVAGGSKGMGGAWSDALAQRGLNVVLTARREGLVKAKAEELRAKYGVEARPVVMDLSSDDMLDEVSKATDDVEIGFLVYNAGYADLCPFAKQPLEKELFRLSLNCRGPLVLSHYFGKKMLARKRGGIAIMSSLGGLMGNPYNVGYAASKAYDLVLAEGLWYEYGKHNVDVIACIAGLTKTHETISDDAKTSGGRAMMPEDVVEEALAKLGKEPAMVPGKGNRRFHFMATRLLSRKRLISMMTENYERNWPELLDGKNPSG